jgi:hypothetical protein
MLKVLICFYIAGNCYVCSHVWHQYLLVGENPHAYQNPSLFCLLLLHSLIVFLHSC